MSEGTYLRVVKLTTAVPTTILNDTGDDTVLIWGAMLYHTAAANASVQLDGVDKIRLGLSGAGSTGVMFPKPLHTRTEPDVDVLSAGEIYIYYETTGSS